jgi:hypothetical protein
LAEALAARIRSREDAIEWESAGVDSEWLNVRDQQLEARLQSLTIGDAKRILLLNATMGLQFYPSIVDFFVRLRRVHGKLRVTSASYFEQIYELGPGVAEKGLPVVAVADVMSWSAQDINRFDVVICIGPSEVMARLMTLEGLAAKLVYLDFGFNHQLIDWTQGAILRREASNPHRSAQSNRVTGYSCQPEPKVVLDLSSMFSMNLFSWRWFNYIPIGFTYGEYYRSDRQFFDVALLGSSGREYAEIDARLFGAMRFLFLGSVEGAPHIERLRSQLDLTVVPRVDEETYARLLALCRCVVLPADAKVPNVFLSMRDTLASGQALVTSRHLGLARLERENIPAVFYDGGSSDLFAKVDELLRSDGRLKDIGERAMAFAKERLDIYGILETIVQEQVL